MANIQHTRLNVKNISRSAYVGSVTAALHGKPGVESFDIQFDTGMVDIEYDAAQTDPQRLAAAIKAAGFETGN